MRIVLCYPIEPPHLAQIQQAAGGWEVCDAGQERLAEEITRCDILCGHVKVPVPWDAVIAAGRLVWIQSSAAGTDHCLVPQIVDCPRIVVTSASGVLADQVAEHTLALVTAFFRGLPTFFAAQQRREFVRRPTRDVHRATLGIVGYGGVGRRVAEVFAPLRTRILAVDLYPPREVPRHVEAVWPADRLADLLRVSDIVVLSVPLTPRTRNMIDRRALALMQPTAVLANMARGQLVVENDLAAALHAGTIAGAVMDVTPEEPLPPHSPLWTTPNTIITPHVGGQSARRAADMTDFFCENLRRYKAGQPLRNVVDKRQGFPVPDDAA